jgi:hypothetical protein
MRNEEEDKPVRSQFKVEGNNHGAMVQEAKKLMAADDDD